MLVYANYWEEDIIAELQWYGNIWIFIESRENLRHVVYHCIGASRSSFKSPDLSESQCPIASEDKVLAYLENADNKRNIAFNASHSFWSVPLYKKYPIYPLIHAKLFTNRHKRTFKVPQCAVDVEKMRERRPYLVKLQMSIGLLQIDHICENWPR